MAQVNQVTGNSEGAGTTVTATINATTGNTLAVGIGTYFTTAVVQSVTDTAGNTYEKKHERKTTGSVEIWVATNITGNASNVITVTFTGSVGSRRTMCVVQFSGRNKSLANIESAQADAAAASGTSATTGSFTPSAGSDNFACLQTQGGTSAVTAGTNYTGVQSNGDDTASEYRANAPGSSQTASISWTTSVGHDFALVALAALVVYEASGSPAMSFTLAGSPLVQENIDGAPAMAFTLSGNPTAFMPEPSLGLIPGATRYLEAAFLNSWFRSALPYQPQLWMGLFTALPTDEGGGTEVSGGNYSRRVLERGDERWSAPAGSPTQVTNLLPIEWGQTTWTATVLGWGVWDAETGGNLLFWYDSITATVAVNNTLRLSPGALIFGMN